jgi:3-dehydroquinate dehydratase-1
LIKPITVRGVSFGGDNALICFPLMEKTSDAVLEETKTAVGGSPDVIKLRADAWNFITDSQTSLNMLKEIRRLTNDIPLLRIEFNRSR